MTTTPATVTVIGGVDTHKHTHYAAAIDDQGRLLGDQEFPANDAGYASLLAWLLSHGNLAAIGVESTGSFGATLTRALTKAEPGVIEVNRPNRIARRMDGKSDRLDAEQIARAVLGQTSTAVPKAKSGVVEMIRTLRGHANQCGQGAHAGVQHALWRGNRGSFAPARRTGRVDQTDLGQPMPHLAPRDSRPHHAAREPRPPAPRPSEDLTARSARRWKSLDEEVKTLNRQIDALVRSAAPELLELHGVGGEIDGQFLVTAGDNGDRIRNEAAFAKLCGVAPQPASSGRTSGRHRLSRGGDRAANSALYIVTIVRMRHNQPTRDYVERRTTEGPSKREILRCLKRYIAREVYANLPRPVAARPALEIAA